VGHVPRPERLHAAKDYYGGDRRYRQLGKAGNEGTREQGTGNREQGTGIDVDVHFG
jgi:hypothetical protein